MFSEEEKKTIPDECKYCYWREENKCNPGGNCVTNKRGMWDFLGEINFNNPFSFKAFQTCPPEVDAGGLVNDKVNNTLPYNKICKKCYFDHKYDKAKKCTVNNTDVTGKSMHRDLNPASETDQLEFWKCDEASDKSRTFYKKNDDIDYYNLKNKEMLSDNLFSMCHYIDQSKIDGKNIDNVPQKYQDMCEESNCSQKCVNKGRILSDDPMYNTCKTKLSTNQYLLLPENFNFSKCFP